VKFESSPPSTLIYTVDFELEEYFMKFFIKLMSEIRFFATRTIFFHIRNATLTEIRLAAANRVRFTKDKLAYSTVRRI
jgi:hypothetical protein